MRFPAWNDTACTRKLETVRMPADAQGFATKQVSIEYTRHCLDASMANERLREKLWPSMHRQGTDGFLNAHPTAAARRL